MTQGTEVHGASFSSCVFNALLYLIFCHFMLFSLFQYFKKMLNYVCSSMKCISASVKHFELPCV